MKTPVCATAALMFAGAVQAQTPPAPPAAVPPSSTLTRDLNSGPPAPAVYLAPVPEPVSAPPANVAVRPPPVPPAAPSPASRTEANPVPPPAPAAAPGVTVLDRAALAALPFTADLPPGFEVVTGRPGPDFRIYTIRRGGQSFVMVYAGPASQFPIYSGQMVEAGGRASIVATEDGVRHALEHLFQRPTAPTEIHVWTSSLEGADRALAEQIAQSVDVR